MMKKAINVVVAVILVALLATVIYLVISQNDSDDEDRRSGDDKNTEEEQKNNKGEEQEQEQYYFFDVVPYVTLRYSGFDGMGTASVQIDHDGLWMLEEDLYKTITSPQKTEETDPNDASNDDESSNQGEENAEFDRKYLEEFKHVFDTMAFVAERTTDLKNGDSVTVKITIDEELAKKCKIALEKKEYTYTVSGLTAMQSVDPFEGLVVKLSGSETNTVVMIDDSVCSDFIRNYVVFEYDKRDAYYNGDHFSVYAKWGDNFHLNNEETVYVFSKDEMDVEVSGLNMYPKTIENIDLTSVLKADWDVINGTIIDYLYNELNLTGPLDEYDHKFNGHNLCAKEGAITYKNYVASCEKAFFLKPKENVDGQPKVILVLKLDYTVNGKERFYYSGGWSYYYESTSTPVSSYLVGKCVNFEVDTSGKIVNDGNFYFLGSDWKTDAINDGNYENVYNRIIAPYLTDYIIDEIDITKYEEVFSPRIANEE